MTREELDNNRNFTLRDGGGLFIKQDPLFGKPYLLVSEKSWARELVCYINASKPTDTISMVLTEFLELFEPYKPEPK